MFVVSTPQPLVFLCPLSPQQPFLFTVLPLHFHPILTVFIKVNMFPPFVPFHMFNHFVQVFILFPFLLLPKLYHYSCTLFFFFLLPFFFFFFFLLLFLQLFLFLFVLFIIFVELLVLHPILLEFLLIVVQPLILSRMFWW